MTESLQKQIRQQKEVNSEQEKINWDIEMKLSKAVEEVDARIRNYNLELMSLDLPEGQTAADLQLDLSTRPSEVFLPLQNLIKAKRTEERSLLQQIQKLKIDLEKGQVTKRTLQDDLAKLERDRSDLAEEMASSTKAAEEEDAKLTSEIAEVKSRLMELRTNCEAEHAGVEGLRGDLDLLKAKAEEKAEIKARKAEQGLEFLEKALAKAEDTAKAFAKVKSEALEALKARQMKEQEKNEALASEIKAMVKKYEREA